MINTNILIKTYIISFIILAFTISSCQKKGNYTCTCSVTDNYNNTYDNKTYSYSSVYLEDAEEECQERNGYDDLNGITVFNDCNLTEDK